MGKNSKRLRRITLGSGIATVGFFALMQIPASANFLNGLTQGFAERLSNEATNLVGSGLERVIGKSFKALTDEVMDDLFGEHPSQAKLKAAKGALNLPDPLAAGRTIEDQILGNAPDPTGFGDDNYAIRTEADKRQALRVFAEGEAYVNSSDTAQAADLEQLQSAQNTGINASQMAVSSQDLTVTQDVMKINNQIAAGNTNLLAALLANQKQTNRLQSLSLSQLTQIARNSEVTASGRDSDITTRRLIRDSASANPFFTPGAE